MSKSDFESLFNKHFQFLCNFANQYVSDYDTAQDICQKVFIKLWEKRSSIKQNQNVKAYLSTAVRNSCLNHIRDNKKYRSSVLDLDCGEIEIAAEEQDDSHQEEVSSRIKQALELLPQKARQVLELSRFQGMKYREIAEELGIAQKTVEAHMSRAMKQLREELKDLKFLLIAIAAFLLKG